MKKIASSLFILFLTLSVVSCRVQTYTASQPPPPPPPPVQYSAPAPAPAPYVAPAPQYGNEEVITAQTAPPPIPEYEQPECPEQGYLWEPGYWAYGNYGYYWVPGVWVSPPQPGLYWTPGWWGYNNGYYQYNEGYWGPQVGYYGGINYGYGYYGDGYNGGRWRGNYYEYNTAVVRVNPAVVRTTYVDNSAVVYNSGSRASYNGPGGYSRQPTEDERRFQRSPAIVRPTVEQQTYRNSLREDQSQYYKNNNGRPANVVMTRINTPSTTNNRNATAPAVVQPRSTPEQQPQPQSRPQQQPQAQPQPQQPHVQQQPQYQSQPLQQPQPQVQPQPQQPNKGQTNIQPAQNAGKAPVSNTNQRPATQPQQKSARQKKAQKNNVVPKQAPADNKNNSQDKPKN